MGIRALFGGPPRRSSVARLRPDGDVMISVCSDGVGHCAQARTTGSWTAETAPPRRCRLTEIGRSGPAPGIPGQDISARILAFWSLNSCSVRMPWSFRLASSFSLLISSSESARFSDRCRLRGGCSLLSRRFLLGVLLLLVPVHTAGHNGRSPGDHGRPPHCPQNRAASHHRHDCSPSLFGLLVVSWSVPAPAPPSLPR